MTVASMCFASASFCSNGIRNGNSNNSRHLYLGHTQLVRKAAHIMWSRAGWQGQEEPAGGRSSGGRVSEASQARRGRGEGEREDGKDCPAEGTELFFGLLLAVCFSPDERVFAGSRHRRRETKAGKLGSSMQLNSCAA